MIYKISISWLCILIAFATPSCKADKADSKNVSEHKCTFVEGDTVNVIMSYEDYIIIDGLGRAEYSYKYPTFSKYPDEYSYVYQNDIYEYDFAPEFMNIFITEKASGSKKECDFSTHL